MFDETNFVSMLFVLMLFGNLSIEFLKSKLPQSIHRVLKLTQYERIQSFSLQKLIIIEF